MLKDSLITETQAKVLKELGFKELSMYYYLPNTWKVRVNCDYPRKNGKYLQGCSLPTADEAIDWLRRKYNIVIYDKIEPFVDPVDDKHKTILFRFGVKQCDTKHLGWNGRTYIGETRLAKNVYSLKREAISIAIKYIVSDEKKKSTKSTTTKKQMHG